MYISAPACKQRQRGRDGFSNKTECNSLKSESICMKIGLNIEKLNIKVVTCLNESSAAAQV